MSDGDGFLKTFLIIVSITILILVSYALYSFYMTSYGTVDAHKTVYAKLEESNKHLYYEDMNTITTVDATNIVTVNTTYNDQINVNNHYVDRTVTYKPVKSTDMHYHQIKIEYTRYAKTILGHKLTKNHYKTTAFANKSDNLMVPANTFGFK